MEFISKSTSKNSKAFIKINNDNFGKSAYKDIRKECAVNGLYLIRLSLGDSLLYSSIKAVKYLKLICFILV